MNSPPFNPSPLLFLNCMYAQEVKGTNGMAYGQAGRRAPCFPETSIWMSRGRGSLFYGLGVIVI